MTNFIVNSLGDTVVVDDKVTLREAIEAANTNMPVGDAPAGMPGLDTIDFDGLLSGGTITLTSGELQITDDLTINGLGAENLTVSGNNASRVFNVDDGDFDNNIDVVIDGLTIADGSTNGSGGGIFTEENLTVTQSTISGNTAEGSGGGISNAGNLTVANSDISGNTAGAVGPFDGGGGIYSFIYGDLTVTDSTISGNTAGTGGGIRAYDFVKITNSTISDNTGGGIDVSAALPLSTDLTVVNSTISGNIGDGIFASDDGSQSVVVINSTISGNTGNGVRFGPYTYGSEVVNSTISGNSGPGFAIYTYTASYAAKPSVENTIIAGNDGSSPDIVGEFTSQGFNLIGNGDGASGFTDGVNGDQVGTSANPIDPKLGPLQDNGGPTETQALLSGSPAIDSADPNFMPPPEFDQRGPGFPRVLDGNGIDGPRIDIGAYELSSPSFFLIEAEDLDLVNYRVEENDSASGGELIRVKGPSGTTGTASGEFTGPSGLYDIVVGYFDDNDGDGLLRFRVNHDSVDNWSLDQDLGFNIPNAQTFQQRTIGGVELEMGDTLTIEGTRNSGDFARVDFIKLLPRSVFDVDSDLATAVSGNDTMA